MVKSTYWLLKNLKIFFFIPVFVVIVYFPIASFYLYDAFNDSLNLFFINIHQRFFLFFPLFSVWWTIFVLKEFMDAQGNELLYIYNKPKHIMKIQLLICLLYSLNVAAYMLVFNFIFSNHFFIMIQLLICSFTMCSFAFFVSLLFNSTGIALLLSVTYCIFLNLFDLDNVLSFISIFPNTFEINMESLIHIVCVFLVGIIFNASGYLISKFKKLYN